MDTHSFTQHYNDILGCLDRKLDFIIHKLSHMEKKAQKAAADNDAILADLTAKVEADTEVDQSAITLLGGLKAALDAAIASGDLSQVQALSDQLGQNHDQLVAAITANTPAA